MMAEKSTDNSLINYGVDLAVAVELRNALAFRAGAEVLSAPRCHIRDPLECAHL